MVERCCTSLEAGFTSNIVHVVGYMWMIYIRFHVLFVDDTSYAHVVGVVFAYVKRNRYTSYGARTLVDRFTERAIDFEFEC